MNSFLYILNHL